MEYQRPSFEATEEVVLDMVQDIKYNLSGEPITELACDVFANYKTKHSIKLYRANLSSVEDRAEQNYISQAVMSDELETMIVNEIKLRQMDSIL